MKKSVRCALSITAAVALVGGLATSAQAETAGWSEDASPGTAHTYYGK